MSDTQAVVTVARPQRSTGRNAVPQRRIVLAAAGPATPTAATAAFVRADDDEPSDADGRSIRDRGAHCRWAMSYVD
ncbi:hypothetical protein ACWGB8_32300 [Kitasatospora sp. NPDC054939]